MQTMGHAVVFGLCRHRRIVYGTDGYRAQIKEQHWRIPTLKLCGFVRLEHDGVAQSLSQIQRAIDREARFDLEQRKKRGEGLYV